MDAPQDFTMLMEKGMKELSAHGAFLSVKSGAGTNTMTISWGFVGFIWGKWHFITVVRPQRYTKEILDGGADSFTVSIPFGDALKEELAVCGTESGRDTDKSKTVRFIPAGRVESPVVEGCHLYYECRINQIQPLDGSVMPPEVLQFYGAGDYHIMYFGEIVSCHGYY
ncbi:MAG: flavin reductase [Clostridiales bacterium]|jgi:flavin reductase (DIM6/NTAB) family NADH-FMN oxidoreductase RutF|nr:flavin reductase [Clostridiales bacterium]